MLDRELNGLLGAMKYFNQHKATIVTFAGRDSIIKDGFEIEVMPAYEYLMNKDRSSEVIPEHLNT